jgi:anti-sigma regulatory factor (Ser/Thr protein kinase)
VFIILRNIDFATRSLLLEITSYSKAHDATLRTYLQNCVERGFETIHIIHARDLAQAELSRLHTAVSEWGAVLTARKACHDEIATVADSSGLRIRCAYSADDSSLDPSSVGYTLRCSQFEKLSSRIRDAMALISWSIPLESHIASRLRLGVYELAVNSIEHGTYLRAESQIEVGLNITASTVTVVYKDNSTLFHTAKHDDVSLGDQIDNRRKHGLGLSMIRKISSGLSFERKGKWNCTTFTLDRIQSGAIP